MFCQLCGVDALEKITRATTMWDTVSPERGRELATDDQFFRPILSQDARLLRCDKSTSSAREVLLALIY